MSITVGSTTPTSGLLTSLGVGSGLDVASLVDKLVAAKKAPQQDQITNQAAAANTQLSALGQISAALSALQSAMAPLSDGSAFASRTVTSGDTTVLGAGSDGTAVNGNYNIVISKLASSLKASSGAFASSSTAVGTGTLQRRRWRRSHATSRFYQTGKGRLPSDLRRFPLGEAFHMVGGASR